MFDFKIEQFNISLPIVQGELLSYNVILWHNSFVDIEKYYILFIRIYQDVKSIHGTPEKMQ